MHSDNVLFKHIGCVMLLIKSWKTCLDVEQVSSAASRLLNYLVDMVLIWWAQEHQVCSKLLKVWFDVELVSYETSSIISDDYDISCIQCLFLKNY